MKNDSIIFSASASILMPFIFVFGFYVIISGADGVGGGFQGGAILTTAFLLKYMIDSEESISIHLLQTIEKAALVFLLIIAALLLAQSMDIGSKYGKFLMVFFNFNIALEVSCGLSIILFRFVFHEEDGYV